MQIDISDEQVAILLSVFPKLGIPGDFSVEERVEMALDSILNSVDSTMDVEETLEQEGRPIDATQLQKEVERTLSPNIGTDFPASFVYKPPVFDTELTFDEIKATVPDNPFVKDADSEVKQRAVAIVFNQTAMRDWKEKDTGILVDKAVEMLERGVIQQK